MLVQLKDELQGEDTDDVEEKVVDLRNVKTWKDCVEVLDGFYCFDGVFCVLGVCNLV